MAADAVKAAPETYKMLLENARVRVLEVRGKPGFKTAMHSHPAHVGVAIRDGKFRFTTAGGQRVDAELKAGQALYLDPVEHTTEIMGTGEAHVIIVELK
jgi:quercetin dioxygenase-like cupin family protein